MEHPVLFHRPIHPVSIQDNRGAIEWIARNVFLRVGLNPHVMVLWFFEFRNRSGLPGQNPVHHHHPISYSTNLLILKSPLLNPLLDGHVIKSAVIPKGTTAVHRTGHGFFQDKTLFRVDCVYHGEDTILFYGAHC